MFMSFLQKKIYDVCFWYYLNFLAFPFFNKFWGINKQLQIIQKQKIRKKKQAFINYPKQFIKIKILDKESQTRSSFSFNIYIYIYV